MSISQKKPTLFSSKTSNLNSCRSSILQNKCRSSKSYTNSSGAIDSRKSCSAKTLDGLSSISKPADRSSFAKSLLSNKIGKGSPTIKKRNPEKDLVDSIIKKPKVECKKAMAARLSEDLLDLLMSHEYASFFTSPVDPLKLGLPDYFEIVKYPMDLGTVKKKMESGVYFLDPLGFSSDVRMTFSNAMMYNPPIDDLHIMAKTLCDFFQLRWKPIVKKLVVNHRAWDEDLSNNQRLGDGLLMSEKKTASEPCQGNLCVNSVTNKKTSSGPEVDERKRGVSLLSSQLSYEKRDRASILLSRFSDIIIKSQEQILGVARKNLEKQKQFNLEKKGENDHLVQNKMEVLKDKISAERKRNRKPEREAARVAINKIEKTVDIYDYYNYRQDLATFGALCSTPSDDIMSSFTSQCNLRLGEISGREILERLGLHLKMDEDEEDREEGEIL